MLTLDRFEIFRGLLYVKNFPNVQGLWEYVSYFTSDDISNTWYKTLQGILISSCTKTIDFF